MDNEIGLLIKKLRNEKNISQETLASQTFISRSTLSMIEIGKRKASEDFLIFASNILEFDFISFIKKSSSFKNFEHFSLTYNLLNLLKMNDVEGMANLLENEIIKNEFNYGEPLGVKNFCRSTVLIRLENDYEAALSICCKFFDIDNSNIKAFKPKVNMPNYYYFQMNNLTFCLYELNRKEDALYLYDKIISFLENTFFNKHIPFTSVDTFYFKQYILTLNNLANSFFYFKNYEKALNVCNKAINLSRRFDILSLLDALLELKTEILYCLGDFEGARTAFKQFKSICEVTEYLEYFEYTTEQFILKYPLIFKN